MGAPAQEHMCAVAQLLDLLMHRQSCWRSGAEHEFCKSIMMSSQFTEVGRNELGLLSWLHQLHAIDVTALEHFVCSMIKASNITKLLWVHHQWMGVVSDAGQVG